VAVPAAGDRGVRPGAGGAGHPSPARHLEPAGGRGQPSRAGPVGTIRRADGSEQLTYNGHPLYTYIGDTAPGQARGNNLNLNGGLWHDVPVSR
jgi:predicted lipoprotein with Yx(FWY)xxD motif